MKMQINEKARRVLSVIMTASMVLSLIPNQAFAGSSGTGDQAEAVSTGEESSQPVVTSEDQSTDESAAQDTQQQAVAAEEQDASAASEEGSASVASEQSAQSSVEKTTNQARAPGNAGISTLATGATYADATSSRDITTNLLNPDPVAKFESPVGSGDYYTVDELKAKYGDDYTIYVGDSVWVKFQYKNLTDVKADESLTFAVPEGLEGNELEVKGIIEGPDGSEQGRYWLEGGLIHLQFSNEYIAKTDGNVSDGFVNFYGTVSEDAIEKPGITFGGVTIAPTGGHVAEDTNQKVSIKKWNGTPDSTTETTYDATKNAEQFTIEIDTTGNTKPVDIDVTDVVKFNPGNVIDNNKAWTVDTDEAQQDGLVTSFTKTGDGTYVWSLKQVPANMKYKLTYWVYLDSANSAGNFSFTNEATPAIGGTTFKPASTDGMEQHQFTVAKKALTNVIYDPATGKATATYTIDVTANANNSGTASNVSVVDTFTTGGKYVTNVTQVSSVGTISDKSQSGDNYSFKWNIGSINPGETKTLTYTAEFDANELFFGDDQASSDKKNINNTAKVYEGDDTTSRAEASARQTVDNQQATKGYEFDTATGKLKFTIVFNGKIPGTNDYFDSVLTNFTDTIHTDGVTYTDDVPVLEAFNNSGTQKTAQLTDANIAGKSSFNIAIPDNMKGKYSYRLTYYVNVPAGIDPSTVIRNSMSAQGVGINGNSPFSLNDTAEAKVADTYAASLSKGVNWAQVAGPEGEYDRIEWNLTVSSSVPAGATITDVATNNVAAFPNVFNNSDMMDPDVTKLCIMNGKDVETTLERGVDYDLVWQGSEMTLTFLKPVSGISKDRPLKFFYRTQLVPTDEQFASMSTPVFPTGSSDHGFNGLNYCAAKNKATLNVNGLTATAEAGTTVNGGFEKYNGTYDSASREIEWKTGLYYNSHNGYVIQGERTITEHIAADQVISRVVDPNGNPVDYTVSEDGRTVTFKVNWTPNNKNDYVYVYTKLNEQYLIEHGLDPDNLVDYEVTNTASIDGFGTQVAVGATAKVTETGTITKDYTYNNMTEQQKGGIEFSLDVNPNGSDLDPESDTLTILDTMNRNLALDADSVRINGQTVADFGQGAELRYDKNSNHFELVIPDGVHCKVTYTAKIVGVVAGETGWLSNTAQIEGRPGTATVDKTNTKRLEVGAGAFSAVPFFVKKLDGDQNLISGATFELKRVDLVNGQLVEGDAIDSDGETIGISNDDLDGTYRWLNLIPTTPAEMGGKGYVYVVRETAAPTGCELDTTPRYIAFAEPSDEMKQAITAAGATLEMVHGGGGNNLDTMFAFKDNNVDEKVNVTVNKTWNDNDNSEGFRPTEITVNLIKDGDVANPVETVQVSADAQGNWSHTFTNLPKYETVGTTRQEAVYTVTEDAVAEYTTVVSGNAADGFTITNTHEVAKTSVDGLKFWDDNSNEDGARPTKITVGVFADDSDEPVATQELTVDANVSAADSNYWTYKFEGLNKYKDDGKRTPIKYTVKEVGSLGGYEAIQTGAADNNYTIKNKYVGRTVLIDKVDDEGNPVPGAELTVEKINETDPDQGTDPDEGDDGEGNLDIEALDDGTTTTIATWTTDGQSHELTLAPGNYVLSEGTVPDGYVKSDPIYFTVNADGTVTITKGEGTVTGDSFNVLQMVDQRVKVSLTATKTWNDADNADGVRPTTVKLQLKANGANVGDPVEVTADAQGNWTHEFTDLPKFSYGSDGTTTEIAYTIAEVDTDANYIAGTPTYETDAAGNVTATLENSHNRETTSVSVSKLWDDASNQDGVRPTSVTLGVFDADDMNTVVKQVTLTTDNADADNADKWDYTFTDLPKNKQVDGNTAEISYVVRELDADGKAVTGGKLTGNADYTVTYDDGAHTVTNSYAPGKVSVSVAKSWDDDANRDGLRPQNITVSLFANGEPTGLVRVLSEKNGWSDTFADLDAKADGADITYTIAEVSVDGYSSEITGSAANGFTVTNTHEIAKVNVEGTKVWNDADNQDGKRPTTVTLAVYDADDMNTAVKTVDLTEANAKDDDANTWSYQFTDLPKNKQVDGQTVEISYVVRETSTDANYTVSYDDATNTVTNTHTPETVDISGTKTWDDAANQDGKRPTSIHVKVMNGTTVAAEKDVTGGSTDGTWSYEFTDLPKYANGQEIAYTVEETAVADYQTTYDGTNITNSYTPGQVAVNVTKVWDDASNQDGLRPESITVKLLADGEDTGKTVTLNEGNGWKSSFTDLDEMKAGKTISYTIAEQLSDDVTANYTTEVTATDSGDVHYAYTITNTHETAKTSVKVNKSWNDRDNKEGKRPEDITVKLLADGEDTGKTVTLNEGNGWQSSFTDLDEMKAGQKIVYTVSETQVDQYDVPVITGDAASGFTVTNNETARKVSLNKVDEQGNPLPGAELMVEKINDTDQGTDPDEGDDGEGDLDIEDLDDGTTTTIATWTTDGTAHDLQLKPGNYVFSEANAPAGYDKSDPIYFTVNDDGTVTVTQGTATVSGADFNIVTMTDKLTVRSINVNKVNAGNQSLADAELQVTGTDATGKTIDPITWTTDGTAHELKLGMGTYKLVETTAPAGYDKIADVEFTVAADGSVSVTGGTAAVDATSGTVTVVATDALTQHDTSFSKVNVGGQPVVGAQLQITGTDAAGQDIEPITWTSGTTPEQIKLPMGSYTFHEEAAPNGYVAVTDITFTVDAEGNITVTDTTSNAMKVAEDGTAVITDQLDFFDLTVAKVDEENGALAGAELQVTGTDGAGQDIEPITWTSGDAPQGLSLAMGDYTLTETKAPAGYDAFADVKFHVDSEGKVTITEGDDTLVSVNGDINIVAIDKLTQFSSAFSKVDMGGNPVIGAELQITGTDALGREIEPISWTSGAAPEQITLPMGSYTFHEESAPNGYVAVTDITFTVDAEGKVTVTDTESNAMEVAEDGTVAVTDQLKPFDVNVNKVDESGKALAGAKLTVSGTDAAGQQIDPISWTSGAAPENLSLPMGAYTLHEDEAPNGYLAINDVTFTVDAEGKVTVVNSALEKIAVSGDNTLVVTDESVPTKPVPAVTTGVRKAAGSLLAKTGDPNNAAIPAAMVSAALLLCAMALRMRQKRDEE